MAAMALRQKAINYIDTLDDEQTLSVIMFIESMPKKKAPLQKKRLRIIIPSQKRRKQQARLQARARFQKHKPLRLSLKIRLRKPHRLKPHRRKPHRKAPLSPLLTLMQII